MNNRTEENAGWKPLTDSERDRLKLLKWLSVVPTKILGFSGITFLVMLLTDVTGKVTGLATHRTALALKGLFLATALIGIVLAIVAKILSKKSRRAKELLGLEDKAMAFYLTKLPTGADGQPRYKMGSAGPIPFDDLLTSLANAPFRDDVVALVILPLERGEDGAIYIPETSDTPIKMDQLRLEAVEIHWGANDLCTTVRLADKNGASRIEMSIGVALRRIHANRFRIDSIDIDSLLGATEELLVDTEQTIASFQASIAQYDADRSTLVSAIVDAVTALSSHGRIFLSWAQICEIGGSLARTLNACPSRKLAEQERTAAALAEFQKQRESAG